jgi:hypothetical protein
MEPDRQQQKDTCRSPRWALCEVLWSFNLIFLRTVIDALFWATPKQVGASALMLNPYSSCPRPISAAYPLPTQIDGVERPRYRQHQSAKTWVVAGNATR